MKEIYSLELHETAVLDTHTEGVDMVVVQRVHGGWIYNYYKLKIINTDDYMLASSVFVPLTEEHVVIDISGGELFRPVTIEAYKAMIKVLENSRFFSSFRIITNKDDYNYIQVVVHEHEDYLHLHEILSRATCDYDKLYPHEWG